MDEIRIGISGFGRIGRSLARVVWDRRRSGDHRLRVVAVNDLADPENLLQLARYDSVMGRFPGKLSWNPDERVFVVEDDLPLGQGELIHFLQEDAPRKIDWDQFGVDVVIESTGRFVARAEVAQHLGGSVRKAIISAPTTDPDLIAVMGVNFDEDYDASAHDIISNASCTTTCLAPVAKILNDAFGIEKGIMNTIHAYTISQRVQDSPHGDARMGRAAAVNLIPTSTGAAKAVARVIPELAGKLNGFCVRAPVAAGSLVSLYAQLRRDVTAEAVNEVFRAAAAGPYEGIVEYNDDPIVSSDVIGSSCSAVFDAGQTMVVDGNLVTVSAWYDNEYGYSSRLADTALKVLPRS